jgi:outer membrane receptor protein involved in Fe transport
MLNRVSQSLTAPLTASLVCGAAFAQQVSQPSPSAVDSVDGITEIVVTAQKREEKLNTVPISISAFSAATLQEMGAKDLQDFAREIPGLSVQPGTNGGAPEIAIRGISSSAGDATVGIYIDDVPVQAPKSNFSTDPNPKLFDIDRVEVLRGPQGTLYGASSEGGTIRYITPTPSLTDYTGQVRSEVGISERGDPSYEFGAAVGGPIVQDELGFRASVWGRRDGGYIDNVSRTSDDILAKNVNQNDSVAGRFSLNLVPGDGLQIIPAFYYQKLSSDNLPLTWSSLRPFQQQDTSETPGVDKFALPSLTVNYDFAGARLTSVSSYFDRTDTQQFDYSTFTIDDLTGGATAILPAFPNYQSASVTTTKQRDITQEVRIGSLPSADPFSYTVGVFFEHESNGFTQTVAEPDLAIIAPPYASALLPGGLSYYENASSIEKQFAGFGEASYKFTNQLKLTVGARVENVKVESQYYANGLYNGGPTPPAQQAVTSSSQTPVNPKASFSYQISDNDLLYVTASRGFRPGGPNTPVPASACAADLAAQDTTAAQLASFKSDSVWNYEVGAKTLTLDNRLAVNGSVYYIDWRDIQQALSLPHCGFGYVANLGHATSKGFDFDAEYKLLEGLTLGVDGGLTRAVLDGNIYQGSALIGRDGDFLLLTPEWTASVNANYRHEIVEGFEGYTRVDMQHTSSFYRTGSEGTQLYDPDLYRGPAYNFMNFRAGIVHQSLNLSFFIKNALNARPVLFASYAQDGNSRDFQQQTTLPPRMFGITAAYKF